MQKYHTPKYHIRAQGRGTDVIRPKTRVYPNISKHVTPADFRRAFRAAQNGDPGQLFAILEFFHKIDDEIPAAVQSLIAAVVGTEVQITPLENSGPEGDRQAGVFQRMFAEMDGISLFEELLKSHYYGFSKPINFDEDSWQTITVDGRTYEAPVTYEALPRDWVYAKKENRSDEHTTLFVGDRPYYEYPDGAVLLMTADKLPSRDDIDFTNFGVGLGCIRLATFKYFNDEDWAAMNEVFATPLILGIRGPGGDEEKLKRAVTEMGTDARAVIDEGDKIEFPQANSSMSGDAYDKFIDRLNKAIAKKIKSESLTDNMNKHGSNAAMYTVNGIRLDVAASLARKLTRLVKRKLCQPVADLNFNGRLLVKLGLPVQGLEDMLTKARTFNETRKLAPGSITHVRKELNWPAPEDEEDTIPVQRSLGFGGV